MVIYLACIHICLIQPIPIYWAASPNPPEYLEFLVCTAVILRGVIDFQSLTALSRGLCTGNAFNKWLMINWIHPRYVWLWASWVNLRASVLKIKIAIAKKIFFFLKLKQSDPVFWKDFENLGQIFLFSEYPFAFQAHVLTTTYSLYDLKQISEGHFTLVSLSGKCVHTGDMTTPTS